MSRIFSVAIISLVLVSIFFLMRPVYAQSPDQQPPNVVFIIVDQMRGDAMSVVGSSNVRTPHLDDLASRGVLFNNFYVNNPVCAPSRMTFFSGLYPHQHGKMANMKGKYRAKYLDRLTDADFTETMRYYYAAIEYGVDQQVGKVMDALEKNNLLDNTIVVFTLDHGDFMAHHGMVCKGMYLYDDLLHVSFIIYAPGTYRKGKVVDNLAQGVDLFPTLIDLTEGSPPADLPGRSLRSIV